MAGKITRITVDVTCGTTSGLNYRVSTAGLIEFPNLLRVLNDRYSVAEVNLLY